MGYRFGPSCPSANAPGNTARADRPSVGSTRYGRLTGYLTTSSMGVNPGFGLSAIATHERHTRSRREPTSAPTRQLRPWTPCSGFGADLRAFTRTNDRSSPGVCSINGPNCTGARSTCRDRANRPTTPISSHSTAGFERNAQTPHGSCRWPLPESASKNGGATTTKIDLTRP